jgi:replicative DNA helicase
VDGWLDSADAARVADALAIFNAWPLTLVDQPHLTPAQLRGLMLRARRERGCDVVCVDYLQLMAPPGQLSLKREYDRVTFVSDALRTLA